MMILKLYKETGRFTNLFHTQFSTFDLTKNKTHNTLYHSIDPEMVYFLTDHAGLEIPVNLSIASPFSRQIAIGNVGPSTALGSMGANPTFRCHFLNIGSSYKQ